MIAFSLISWLQILSFPSLIQGFGSQILDFDLQYIYDTELMHRATVDMMKEATKRRKKVVMEEKIRVNE